MKAFVNFKDNWWRFGLSALLLMSAGSAMQFADLYLTRCIEHPFDASDTEPGIWLSRILALMFAGPTRLLGIPSVIILFSLIPFYDEFLEYIGDVRNLLGTVIIYILGSFGILWLALSIIALAFFNRPVPIAIWIITFVLLPILGRFRYTLLKAEQQLKNPNSLSAVANVATPSENKIATVVVSMLTVMLLFAYASQESAHGSEASCETRSGAHSQSGGAK